MSGSGAAGERDPARITVEESPYNAEIELGSLADPCDRAAAFYVRSHFDVPSLAEDAFRLTVGGALERTLELSLDELRGRPVRTLAVTLECAGNGRRLMRPTPGGTPWSLGAVSTASFTGTPLAGLLADAGVREEAVELVTAGADAGELPGGEFGPYARSLPLEVVRDPDTLLAWAMDGEPLRPEHGAPLRLVVPGWYAMASVKWLDRLEAVTEPFLGPYQALRYVYVGEEGTPHRLPVTRMRVRSLIARPAAGSSLAVGEEVALAGSAWSGRRRVVRVEVSTDGGRSWEDAELGEPAGPHAAAPWRFRWTPRRAGAAELVVRATDDAGERQPLEPRWNRYGYGNNVVHRVGVDVGG